MRYGVGRALAFDLIVSRDAGLKLPCFEFLFLEIDFVALLVVGYFLRARQMPHAALGYTELQGGFRSVECLFRGDLQQSLDPFQPFLYSHTSSSSCIIFDISGMRLRASQ